MRILLDTVSFVFILLLYYYYYLLVTYYFIHVIVYNTV